ncbi:MAG TPA: lysophospholipid acyltransferase family protein [Desulfobacteria bacterium]|nr:lysophospholipid acyltransferase family protein [Desulfobacteria bacterium]
MFRTILWTLFLVLRTLFTAYDLLIVYILGALGMREGQEERIAAVGRNWSRSTFRATGSTVNVIGADLVPSDGAVLFVSNHQSNFDIALMLGYIPRAKGFVAKIELHKIPLVRTWMYKMHSVFLDRKNLRQSVLTMRKGVEILKAGNSLVIFPEGTRSRGSRMGDFKRGSLSLAERANVPIVPVTIVDSYKILEGNQKFRITPSEVTVYVSEPIYPAALPKGQDLTALVQSTIAAKLPDNDGE